MVALKDEEDGPEKDNCEGEKRGGGVYSTLAGNILLLAPLIIFVSIALATLFYYCYNDWPLSTSLFFATQALFGCMYEVPSETRPLSEVFTMGLYLWGSTLCAGAIGAFTSHVVEHASIVSRDERKKLRLQNSDEAITPSEFLSRQSLFSARMRNLAVVAALGWLVLGTVSISFLENKSVGSSLFFSIGAVTSAGTPTPVCLSSSKEMDCEMGAWQSLLLSLYIIIGVPLFTFAFGQFALAIVERAIRADERKVLERPLTQAEFQLLRSLHHREVGQIGRTDVFELSLSDFIVLELIRLQKIDEDDLANIKRLFDKLKLSELNLLSMPSSGRRAPSEPPQPRYGSSNEEGDARIIGLPAALSTPRRLQHHENLDTDTPSTTPSRLRRSISLNASSGLDIFNAAVLATPGGGDGGGVVTLRSIPATDEERDVLIHKKSSEDSWGGQ